MKFRVHQRKHPNEQKYPGTDFQLAKKFSSLIVNEIQDFVKSIVLFGSATRKEKHSSRAADIDILIIIDDLSVILSPEVVEAYRIITEKTAAKVTKRFHITTMKLTSFWDYLRNGDPIVVNMLRDGIPLYDVGFYTPAQALLFQGRIRPTRESIWNYFARAPVTMLNADWHILQATVDLYWAVIDSAHAALMKIGEIPPSPDQVASLINYKLVKRGMATRKEVKTMQFFYDISKKITHRQIQKVTGPEFEKYKQRAHNFIKVMQKIIEKS